MAIDEISCTSIPDIVYISLLILNNITCDVKPKARKMVQAIKDRTRFALVYRYGFYKFYHFISSGAIAG
jgi:hypothetical protein